MTRKKIISLFLVLSMLFSLTSCSKKTGKTPSSNGFISIEEHAIDEEKTDEIFHEETTIEEARINEFITEEIYLRELIVAEAKITELLLEDENINEVLICKTIYVPQNKISEFANNSQIAQLFGNKTDIFPLMEQVAVGTGIIVTLVVFSKVKLPEPIASVVVAAADKSVSFAKSGAMIGSLFGALTGGSDVIDESGRASACVSFAIATAGLIITATSLIASIPSGGTSTISAVAGLKMVIAGVELLAAGAGTVYAGYNAVKTFKETDATNIDWENVDWEKVGTSAAQKAINNSATGYMWGTLIGTVHGGIDGFEFYQTFSTPYTNYNFRIMQTPKEGNGGHWTGKRGESDFVLDKPIELSNKQKVFKVTYQNGVPDFSPYQEAQVKILNMTDDRSSNFRQADEILAEYWTRTNYRNQQWTARDIEYYRKANDLTWHEMSNMDSMQLVPSEVNSTFTHCGGVAEYKAMVGQEENSGLD